MRNLSIYIIILGLFCFSAYKGFSQDIHFSQYFANPISYNPANTGFFEGSYRLGINHKQQWPWAIDNKFLNYNSSSGYADFSILDKKLNDYDWMGLGVNFINDNAGDGNLKARKAYASVAYHKGLDRFHKHFLSLGYTIGYVHRSINFDALYFNNQWEDRLGFNLTLPNNEGLSDQSTGYFDMGFGLQNKSQWNEKFTTGLGFSVLHFNRPKETFYNQSNKLGVRYLAHLMVEYEWKSRWTVTGTSYMSFQKKAREIMFGALFGYEFQAVGTNKTSKIFWGTYYRVKDALTPLFGYQYNNTRLLLNYDVNLSSLTKASRGKGGFELSLTHVGTFAAKKGFNKKVHCPTF